MVSQNHSNSDVTPMRGALDSWRALDTNTTSRENLVSAGIAMAVAADGLVSYYLDALDELATSEDALTGKEEGPHLSAALLPGRHNQTS